MSEFDIVINLKAADVKILYEWLKDLEEINVDLESEVKVFSRKG